MKDKGEKRIIFPFVISCLAWTLFNEFGKLSFDVS